MPEIDSQPKTIFITGASAGIGRAAAELFLKKGWKVWGSSRKGVLPWEHENLRAVSLDLADAASVRQAAQHFLSEAVTLDVLVNNGGSGIFGSWEDMSPEDIRSQFEILVLGPLELTRLLLPALRQSKGHLINVTSLATDFPIPFLATYSAAKAALSNLTQGLQLELHGSGIRVVDLQPGDIRTDFHGSMEKRSLTEDYAIRGEKCFEYIEKSMREAPLPHTVADRILLLAIDPDPAPAVACGSFLHQFLAPLGHRILPRSGMNFILRYLYRLE